MVHPNLVPNYYRQSTNQPNNVATTSQASLVSFSGLVGEIKLYASDILPVGWLLCDGSYYNISDYPNLYSVIGASFATASPPPVSTFRVPNLNQKIPVLNLSQSIGTESGANLVTLVEANVPSHSHFIRGGVLPDTNEGTGAFLNLGTMASDTYCSSASVTSDHMAVSSEVPTPTPVDVRQASLSVVYMIKT